MKNKSIKAFMNQLVILPLLCLAVIMLVVFVPVIYGAIISETREGLKNLSHALLEKCNVMGEGDYHIDNNVLYKGEVPIGINNQLVDNVKEVSGIDATIFWNDTRMLTTVEREDGERAVGTKAAPEVVEKVIGDGKEYFFSNVRVNDIYYYGYYVPMKNDDTIVGMVFVGKPRERVITTIFHVILLVVLIVVIIMIAALAIALRYVKGIEGSFSKTKEFLGKVASGNLECEIDTMLLGRRDELGEMGRSAQMMQKSILKLIGTDPLTELYNRRSCNEALEKAINECKQSGKRCSVVIGDIDDFKVLNDTYGHLTGDQVLKVLSDVFRNHMNGKGIAARWGGEEFLLLYGEENAVADVRELLEEIRAIQIPYKEHIIQFTMTFGISICSPCDTIETITKRADERLYYGKKNGKNQVVEPEKEEILE